MLKKYIVALTVSLITLVMLGCSATTYRDPRLGNVDLTNVAVFDPSGRNKNFPYQQLVVEAINGERRSQFQNITRYELVPGENSITFSLWAPGWSSGTITRKFVAKGGKEYVGDFHIYQKGRRWKRTNWWEVRILEKDIQQPVDSD